MNRAELLDRVKSSCPPLEWEHERYALFGKYGYASCVSDKWIWDEEELEEALDTELLEMLVEVNGYWKQRYEEWYDRAAKKSRKLDLFMGECERKYFGYDSNGYTEKTIDRIFDAITEILDEKFPRKQTEERK